MSFGEDFLQGFFGSSYLKDYRHASKTFRSNGYELAPRQKFLFHTFFNLNTSQIPRLGTDGGAFTDNSITTLGLLCKSVELPRYSIDVETKNQYNRKRLVQSKIEYLPINIVFHDDAHDLTRSLWYNYFSYYYKDPTQQYSNPSVNNGSATTNSGNGAGTGRFSYNDRDIYSENRNKNDWGYIGESYDDTNSSIQGGKPIFMKDITIFGFNQHNFVAYVLINPLIQSWEHDTYDYGENNGIMENRVQIAYETVKYYSGALGGDPSGMAPGFATDAYYDKVKSSLARPGSTSSILGQGGLIDAVGGIIRDLNQNDVSGLIGAVQKAGTAYETFKGKDLQSVIREEGATIINDVLRNTGPEVLNKDPTSNNGQVFPTNPEPGSVDPTATNGLKPANDQPTGPQQIPQG